jgi:uncharacterized cupin superfamily protein
MPKLDLAAIAFATGSNYPDPFNDICLGSRWQKLGDAAGLSDFGVNLVRLAPGKWSSQRHWHSHEDEFVWVLEGEVVMVDDAGEHVLRPGDACGWRAGERNGHHLQNRTGREAVYLEVGSRRAEDGCDYPDIDMVSSPLGAHYQHRDGTPYPAKE